MKKSRSFVPTTSRLEDRLALSGPTLAANGLPVLTAHAAQDVTYGVNLSYSHLRRDGFNFGHLNNDLNRVVNRIPFNTRDGLTTTLANDVNALRVELANDVNSLRETLSAGVSNAVIASRAKVGADIEHFIIAEVQAGNIIFR